VRCRIRQKSHDILDHKWGQQGPIEADTLVKKWVEVRTIRVIMHDDFA